MVTLNSTENNQKGQSAVLRNRQKLSSHAWEPGNTEERPQYLVYAKLVLHHFISSIPLPHNKLKLFESTKQGLNNMVVYIFATLLLFLFALTQSIDLSVYLINTAVPQEDTLFCSLLHLKTLARIMLAPALIVANKMIIIKKKKGPVSVCIHNLCFF